MSDLPWNRDRERVQAATREPGLLGLWKAERSGPWDLQVLISNMVIGNCRPAGRRNSALCKPCRRPPGRVICSYLGQPFQTATVWPAWGQLCSGNWQGRSERGRGATEGWAQGCDRTGHRRTGASPGLGSGARSSIPGRFTGAPYRPASAWYRVYRAELRHSSSSFLAGGVPGSQSGVTAS